MDSIAPRMDLDLSQEHELIRRTVREFAVELLGERSDALLGELPDSPANELVLLAQIEVHRRRRCYPNPS